MANPIKNGLQKHILDEKSKRAFLIDCKPSESKKQECTLVNEIDEKTAEQMSPYKHLEVLGHTAIHEGVSCTLLTGFLLTDLNVKRLNLFCYNVEEGFKHNLFIRIDNQHTSMIGNLVKKGNQVGFLSSTYLHNKNIIHEEKFYFIQIRMPTKEEIQAQSLKMKEGKMEPLGEEEKRSFKKTVNIIRGINGLQISKILHSGYVKDRSDNEILQVVLEVTEHENDRFIEERFIKQQPDSDWEMKLSENPTYKAKVPDTPYYRQDEKGIIRLLHEAREKTQGNFGVGIHLSSPDCDEEILLGKDSKKNDIRGTQEITPFFGVYNFKVLKMSKRKHRSKSVSTVFRVCKLNKIKGIFELGGDYIDTQNTEQIIEIKEIDHPQNHSIGQKVLELFVDKGDKTGAVKKITFE